jgi:hypothetical protein
MARSDCGNRSRRSLAALALAFVVAACATPAYSPYPLDLSHQLPADAFLRCREVLLNHYGALSQSDQQAFRLETAWQPISDPPGERRASVFRDQQRANSLAVVVELRRLSVPLIGAPYWTTPRGDDMSERQLAEWLRESLRDLAVPGLSATAAGLTPDSSLAETRGNW